MAGVITQRFIEDFVNLKTISVTHNLGLEFLEVLVIINGIARSDLISSITKISNNKVKVILKSIQTGRIIIGEPDFVLAASQSSGSPGTGTPVFVGEGGPFSGIVFTTDNTATSTADGGTFVDVTISAKDNDLNTFTFQGVTANHTILFGSDIIDPIISDVIKHFGIQITQTIATAEITPKSFVIERWDGASWVETTNMTVHENQKFRYANELFIRPNITEQIRFGVFDNTPWVKKLINGQNLFWHRIRIVTTVATAPVFEQLLLFGSSSETGTLGIASYHGNARFRNTVLAAGNIFGESGGVSSKDKNIGTGGLPTGWKHKIKNSLLRGNGAAIYMQFNIPRGMDTSMPLKVDVCYTTDKTGGTSPQMIISLKPNETVGILEADSTGGIIPVARTDVNTELLTTSMAQTSTFSLPITSSNKILSTSANIFDISNFYEGDLLAIRIELDNDGNNPNKDILIWTVEISGIFWTLGERI